MQGIIWLRAKASVTRSLQLSQTQDVYLALFLPPFYNLNFWVSLLFGCVSPSLRRPKPRQVTRSSGFETLIRKLLSFVLNIWPFLIFPHRLKRKMTILCQIFWQKNVRLRKYSSATQVLHLSCNSELQALHHVVNVRSNTNGTEAGIFQVFFKGGYRPWTPPPQPEH